MVDEGSLGHGFPRYLGFPLSSSFFGCSIHILYAPSTAAVKS